MPGSRKANVFRRGYRISYGVFLSMVGDMAGIYDLSTNCSRARLGASNGYYCCVRCRMCELYRDNESHNAFFVSISADYTQKRALALPITLV